MKTINRNEICRKVSVSPVEALIIYLSAGAPFGVLVFFSQRTSKIASLPYAMLAIAGWPILGPYRLYRSLSRRRSYKPRQDSISDDDLIDVLERLLAEVPTEPAELFEIAGHPNPWLATNCNARARKKVVDSHLDRLSMSVVESSSFPVLIPQENELQRVNSLVT